MKFFAAATALPVQGGRAAPARADGSRFDDAPDRVAAMERLSERNCKKSDGVAGR